MDLSGLTEDVFRCKFSIMSNKMVLIFVDYSDRRNCKADF